VFTSLYSGDANFQPTTGSGSAFAVTVNGTPVTLTISPSSVAYTGTFNAAVVVTGTAGEGAPAGTVTLYTSAGLVVGTITIAASGNNSAGNANITATSAHNLNVGSNELYAIYTPTTGSFYQLGSSSDEPLTVTPATTSTAIACSPGFLAINCTATVTNTVTGTAVPAGLTVDFSVNGGGATPETTNAAGQATFATGEIFGSFTVAATFPTQTNYQTSSASTTVLCFFICGLDRTGTGDPFNSFTLFGEFGQANQPTPFRLF
jgi:hypothetical protein